MSKPLKKKKYTSITRLIVLMLIVQALILVLACLLVSMGFYRREIGSLYDEMNQNITGAAIGSLWEIDYEILAKDVNEVVQSIDDPKQAYETDMEAYRAKFKSIQDSARYQKVWGDLESVRVRTTATSIDLVLIYPGEDYGIYIIDASGSNILPCGEYFELKTKSYIDHPETFKRFISQSPAYGPVRTDGVSLYLDEEKGIYAYLTADIPISRLISRSNTFYLQCLAVCAVITVIVCILLAQILRIKMVHPLKEISETAEKFVDDYEERYDAKSETHIFDRLKDGRLKELKELSMALQSMELEMNSYMKDLDIMTTERARIATELDLATSIQAHLLPAVADPFPDRKDFSIYASMDPAKEVGGDLYDFFLLDEDHLCLVIADVSGKGIPAALFMAIAKELIHNRIKSGDRPAEAIRNVNAQICENNSDDMFVTVWLALLDLKTGKGLEVNAGHEHPAIRRKNGTFEIIKYHHNMALGTFEMAKYTENEFELHKGDTIFVYTDGVPEAINTAEEQFGDERMLGALNKKPDADCRELLENVRSAVDEFVGTAPQFDDLTMLALKLE